MSKITKAATSSLDLKHFYHEVHGPVKIPMNNDYLFKVLMQEDTETLQNLIAALLHMEASEIISVEIQNPINLGQYAEEKDIILDLKIILNKNKLLNLEMQVVNEGNWPERSLYYLCRTYNNLEKGNDYKQIKPAIQIGFTDFTVFKETPEFYATYRMINEKTGRVYTDKFRLSILELCNVDLATEEDKRWKIDSWARFFKAKTWEEIKMIAHHSKEIEKAAESVYKISAEEKIRLACEAREESNRIRRTIEHERREAFQMLEDARQKNEEIKQKNEEIKQKNEEIKQQNEEIKQQNKEIKHQNEEIKQQNEEMKKMLKEKDEENARLRAMLEMRD